MEKKRKRPEEFGLTDKTIYIYPQKAMPYWLQFTPKEFLNRMIHDAGVPLYPIRDLLGFLGESMEEGEISFEGQLGLTNLDEHIQPLVLKIRARIRQCSSGEMAHQDGLDDKVPTRH